MLDIFDISGKKVIITGGSRGLGKGMARGFVDSGCDVIIMGSNNKVHDVAQELNGGSGSIRGVSCDLNKTEDIVGSFHKAYNMLGEIDVLVNNAGMQIRHPSEEFPVEDWEKILNVNLTAPFLLAQLAGNKMLKKGSGKIINIASLTSFSGGMYIPAYAASKGGIAQMTKTLCNEWASKGINVNAIAPGYMDTDNLKGLDEERMRTIMDRLPSKRLGTPEDIVGAVIFLSSKASDYINGHILLVDGGWMAR